LKGTRFGLLTFRPKITYDRHKWIFRNKLDEAMMVMRNKNRLVAKGYNQDEEIAYDQTFALVARLGTIRMFLPFASYAASELFQMDVKCTS